MTGQLRLWAVHLDTVQQIGSAPPDLADRLRQVTLERFPVRASRPGRGLADKLGPLLRRPRTAPRIDPAAPGQPDAEAILTGRFVPPDRLEAAWVLFEAWLDALSAAHLVRPVSVAELETVDFDLARAGVPSPLDLYHFRHRGLDVPLRPLPGLTIGSLRAAQVMAVATAWRAHLDDLEGSVDLIRAILDFIDAWLGQSATPEGSYDLVTSWRP
jgi:hypothetical protein